MTQGKPLPKNADPAQLKRMLASARRLSSRHGLKPDDKPILVKPGWQGWFGVPADGTQHFWQGKEACACGKWRVKETGATMLDYTLSNKECVACRRSVSR